ncbi:MAG: CBS domain-containing protein [Candidatus Omnitrophica bacterium]|nr:CBS domain-containing protein [Candidatus Omnitrophota bacterium]
MNETNQVNNREIGKSYFLSEIVKLPVFLHDNKIGKLTDFLIVDKDKIAEVTHLCIARPFGEPALLVPWEKLKSLSDKNIIIDIETIEQYTANPPEGAILLKDYILDKRVLDGEGREVEMVYDVKLVLKNSKLYVTDVDLSKYGLLRRIGLKWLADFIYNLAAKIRSQTVSWSYVEPLPEQISSFKGDLKLKVLKERLADMPPVDLADILEEMDPAQRVAIFGELDTEHASDTLEELDPRVQRDMIASLKKERAAQLINEMTPGQAADILSVLPWWEVKAILQLLNKENAIKIQDILEKQEEKIVDFAATNFLKFTPERTALQARRAFQRAAKGKEAIMYLYILDEQEKLLGVIDLKELLIAEDEVLLKDVMVSKVIILTPESTLKQASEMFARYSFRALPIIDKSGKMLGVVPYRDVMNLKHLYLG